MQPLPGFDQIIQYLIIAFVLLIGLVILIAIVKVVLHFFLAVVAGVIVWYLTGYNLLFGALGFLAVAIITTGKRKQKVVYVPQQQPVGKVCPNCKTVLAQNARFCPACGRSV